MSVIELMKKASETYYDGEPIMTDSQYDALERIHGQIIAGNGDVPHSYRMYSLNKHYEGEREPPFSSGVETVKLDGAAVSILYVQGEFVHALTRGNGIRGKDISDRILSLDVPTKVPLSGIVQVTGEVVAHKNIPNSRNFASGALNLKDNDEYFKRVAEGNMTFVAYNVQNKSDSWGIKETYEEDMDLLRSSGFYTILDKISWTGIFPEDGTVMRVSDNNTFNSLGFTDKFPRGAYAIKTRREGVHTKLLDVIWQTGKSGKVSPVAILEPIVIGGATISRATLNNMAFIEALGLEIGCKVSVIRSGEIIPCIVERVD